MKFFVFFYSIVVIFITQWDFIKSEDIELKECIVEATGVEGTCQPVTKCLYVIQTLRTQKPTICGYNGPLQIVCCPNPPTATTTHAPPSAELLNTKRHLKCVEYAKSVYEITERIPLPNGTIYEHKLDRCAFTAVPLIVNGTAANPKEFPHSALLGYQIKNGPISWECGGSLVSELFVITAGHCLKSRDNGYVIYVKLGDLNTGSDKDDARPEIIRIAEIIPNPQYKKKYQYNDIALLRLEKSVIFNPYIRPICLPLEQIAYEKAIATGWGATEWEGKNSQVLLKVTLETFSYSECNESYKYNTNRKLSEGIIDKTQLCAGSKSSNKDTCQGDSGGPLQVYNPDVYCMYTLIGITSFGIGCGTENVPAIYTRVDVYLDWIESVIWPN